MKEALIEATVAPQAAQRQLLPEDFDCLVREHQRRIYRVLFLLLRDQDAADSLTQECFLRAFRGRAGFRREADPGTWLVRIAVNLAHDHRRSRRAWFWKRLLRAAETLPPQADDRSSQEARLLAREQVDAVWAAVERLPARRRTVFVLRFGEEMSLNEIAGAMGLGEGTVKAHLSAATESVRKELARRFQSAGIRGKPGPAG